MCFTYRHVRKTDVASSRWRLGGGRAAANPSSSTTGRMTNAVFWQFTLYVVSFMLTWPVYFAAMLIITRFNMAPYGYWVVLAILTPLQGCWNAIVYFRPMVVSNLEQKRLKQQREEELISPQDAPQQLPNNHQNDNLGIQGVNKLCTVEQRQAVKQEMEEEKEALDIEEATDTSTTVYDSLGSSAMDSLAARHVSFQQLPDDDLEDGTTPKDEANPTSSIDWQHPPLSAPKEDSGGEVAEQAQPNHQTQGTPPTGNVIKTSP